MAFQLMPSTKSRNFPYKEAYVTPIKVPNFLMHNTTGKVGIIEGKITRWTSPTLLVKVLISEELQWQQQQSLILPIPVFRNISLLKVSQSNIYNSESHSWSESSSHNVNTRFNYSMNKKNRFYFTPSFSFSKSDSRSLNMNSNIQDNDTINITNSKIKVTVKITPLGVISPGCTPSRKRAGHSL